MNRPLWDETWMDIARTIAMRSTCIRRQIGAVITYSNRILSTGHNGACRGNEHCSSSQSCIRNKSNIPSGTFLEVDRAVHAEQNALLNLPFPLWTLPNKHIPTMYVTTYPCPICAKLIINAGIKRVVCYSPYSNNMAMDDFVESNITVEWVRE